MQSPPSQKRCSWDTTEQSALTALDLPGLESSLPDLRERYSAGAPFPHIVLDNFLRPATARRAVDEFPAIDSSHWIDYVHFNERKFANVDLRSWEPTLQRVAGALNSDRFVRFLSELTGIEGLLVDESMEGGGLHQSLTNGFLNVHADFTVHPGRPRWRRRVNLLLYLNSDWRMEYGGELELWSTDMKRCEKTIAPLENRVVIFNTDADSFHGHPEPLRCPTGMARQSMAFYYFTDEDRPVVRSTEYRSRPGEGPRSVLIYLDKQVLRTYDRIKRRLGLSDRDISRILKPLSRLRRKPGPP